MTMVRILVVASVFAMGVVPGFAQSDDPNLQRALVTGYVAGGSFAASCDASRRGGGLLGRLGGGAAGRTAGEGPEERGPRAAAHVLLAPGDAGCSDASDSGTGRTCQPLDHAALHAPQSGCDRGGDSAPGSAVSRSQSWRHCGDGQWPSRKCLSSGKLMVDRMGLEPTASALRTRRSPS